MDAETREVIGAAWEVVNHSFQGNGYTVRKRLTSALQAHAQAHPSELTTGGVQPTRPIPPPPPPPNETTPKEPEPDKAKYPEHAFVPLAQNLIGRVFNAARVVADRHKNNWAMGDQMSDLEEALDACNGTYTESGIRVPRQEPRSSAQPTILQLEKGDVCVLGMSEDASVPEMSYHLAWWREHFPGVEVRVGVAPIQVLRPAKEEASNGSS